LAQRLLAESSVLMRIIGITHSLLQKHLHLHKISLLIIWLLAAEVLEEMLQVAAVEAVVMFLEQQ
jgi:hypothetical protein